MYLVLHILVLMERTVLSTPGLVLALLLLFVSQLDPIVRCWWKNCGVEFLADRKSAKDLLYFCLDDPQSEGILWLDDREFVVGGEWYDVVSTWKNPDGSVELMAYRDRADERAAGIALRDALPGTELPQLYEPWLWGDNLLYLPGRFSLTNAHFHPGSPTAYVPGAHFAASNAPESPPPDLQSC